MPCPFLVHPRLLSQLQAVSPAIVAAASTLCPFHRCQRALHRRRQHAPWRLADVRRAGPLGGHTEGAAEEFFVIPRFGTISPWASKATDVAHNCGMAPRQARRTRHRFPHQPEIGHPGQRHWRRQIVGRAGAGRGRPAARPHDGIRAAQCRRRQGPVPHARSAPARIDRLAGAGQARAGNGEHGTGPGDVGRRDRRYLDAAFTKAGDQRTWN